MSEPGRKPNWAERHDALLKLLPWILVPLALFGWCYSTTSDTRERAEAIVAKQEAREPTQFREAPETTRMRTCTLAGTKIQRELSSGLDGFEVTLGQAVAVPSGAHERANFVAARVHGPSMGDGQIGVWLVSGPLDDPGMYLAVNGIAQQFSVFPRGGRTRADATMSDPGASDAKRCLQ